MPATNKVGTQLLVSPHVRAQAQALALVRQESVAEVYRVALEGGGLAKMEKAHAGTLLELDATLNMIGGNRIELLDLITRRKIRYGDLMDPAVQADIRLIYNKAITVPTEIHA